MKKLYLILNLILVCQSSYGMDKKPTITIANLPKKFSKHITYQKCDTKKKKELSLNTKKISHQQPEKYQTIVYDKKGKRYIATRAVSNDSTLNFPDNFSISNDWVPLKDELNYSDACFLTAHNAHTNKDNGWIYAQQKWSIRKQLEHGVRGLMLDLHNGKNNSIVLAHGGTSCCHGLQKVGSYQTFANALSKILTFVQNNSNEIITLFLENNLTQKTNADDAIKSVQHLMLYVLTKSDWNPAKHNGEWPTIGWLRKNNKRIIFFDNYYHSNIRFQFVTHCTENQWGTFDVEKVTEESGRSKTYSNPLRTLFLLNYFASATPPEFTHSQHNSYQQLKAVVLRAKEKNIAKKQTPNFIALDFVNQGSALRLVNRINDMATSKLIPIIKTPKTPVQKKKKSKLKNTDPDKEKLVNTDKDKTYTVQISQPITN